MSRVIGKRRSTWGPPSRNGYKKSLCIIRFLTITIIVCHSRCSTGNCANIFTRLNMFAPDVLHDLELLPGRFIGEENPAFIIAEIGQNHNGKRST